MGVVGRSPRQRDDVAIGLPAEMPDRRIADQAAGAGDQDFFTHRELQIRRAD